jgi:polyisoprenoid-binding protein YceI
MKFRLFAIYAACLLPPAIFADEQALVVDPAKSHVGIDVNVTLDSFTAHISKFASDIVLDSDFGDVTRAQITFNFADLKTGDSDRDTEMDVWAQADKFPDGAFTLSSFEPVADGQFRARGKLRFHGVERAVSFLVSVSLAKKIFTIDGDTTLDTRDYGLPPYRKYYFITANPIVRVQFHLVGKLAQP